MKLDGSTIEAHPRNAAEALEALSSVAALLQKQGDPRAAFPDIYAIITRRVTCEIERPDGVFLEPAWISRLAGRFCEAYLETLRCSLTGAQQPCVAWELAYRYGQEGASVPAQQAMLGLSAHINYDLALGIHATIVEFGHARDARMLARYKRDHDRVNELLHDAMYEALERLIEEHRCALSEVVYRRARNAARWATMILLRRWRAHVWRLVVAMLEAESPAERDEVVAGMGRRAALIAQVLTLPSAAWVAGRALLSGSEPEPRLAA